jgi:hypothetical protein
MKPAADGFVHRAKARHVIAGDDQLEVRDELEQVLAHEPRCNFIASGEELDLWLSPGAAWSRAVRSPASRPAIGSRLITDEDGDVVDERNTRWDDDLIFTATRWQLFEASLVGVPADGAAMVRSMSIISGNEIENIRARMACRARNPFETIFARYAEQLSDAPGASRITRLAETAKRIPEPVLDGLAELILRLDDVQLVGDDIALHLIEVGFCNARYSSAVDFVSALRTRLHRYVREPRLASNTRAAFKERHAWWRMALGRAAMRSGSLGPRHCGRDPAKLKRRAPNPAARVRMSPPRPIAWRRAPALYNRNRCSRRAVFALGTNSTPQADVWFPVRTLAARPDH